MSLGIVFKGTEGIVLAADSRVTLMAQLNVQVPPGLAAPPQIVMPATFDNATKLLKVKGQDFVGAVTYGIGAIGGTEPRTAHSFIPELETQITETHPERLDVEEFAQILSDFFMDKWTSLGMPATVGPAEQMVFLIGGIDKEAAYGRIFEVRIPNTPAPQEHSPGDFGLSFGGQREFVDRLLRGYDIRVLEIAKRELRLPPAAVNNLEQKLLEIGTAIPFQFLPLQDCVDLSIFLIRTTINLQTWQIGVRGVGGFIDVATVTRTEGFRPIQQKTLKGE
jgi:hypothetical protein